MRMLIAENDHALGTFLARGLERDGHEITLTGDGATAMEAAQKLLPDMALLDLNLPQRDGLEVLEFLRSLTQDLPILILTARQEPETRVRCLEMGADDFMQKPFSFAELRARTRALGRRRSPGTVLRYADLEMNRLERSVHRAGRPVSLTNKEFALLEYLLLHRGCPVARATLLEKVWEMDAEANTNVVDVYVNYLRRKLGEHQPEKHDGDASLPLIIQTVRGFGYGIGLMA